MPTFPFTPSHLPAHARQGHVKKLEQALKDGADPNGVDLSGASAMHQVMEIKPGQGRRMIDMLVKAGADVNALDEKGNAPLHNYLRVDKPIDQLTALLDAGAALDLRNRDGSSPLDLALQRMQQVAFDLLIARGAPVNQRLGADWTVLHRAASLTVSSYYTEALLAAGADPFIADPFGRTPLSIARGPNVAVLNVWVTRMEQAALRATLEDVAQEALNIDGQRARPRL